MTSPKAGRPRSRRRLPVFAGILLAYAGIQWYALAAAYVRNGDRERAIQYAREARRRAAESKQAELLALIERDLRILEEGK